MKKIYYNTTIAALAILFFSCQKIEYSGEYSKDGFYNTGNKVYFYFAEQKDSINHYSFGAEWIEHTRQIVKIPVKITGLPSKKPLTFKVSVDEKASTAKVNKHYTAFSGEFQIPADSVKGYLNVEVWREHLSSDKKDSIRLVLQLENTPDLQAAFPENKKVIITMDDYLEEPFYWVYYSFYWGPYSQIKYRKFLEYYDGNPVKMYDALQNDFNGLSMNFVKVYRFFEAHPEYNQVLPDFLYIPYQ